MSDDRSDDLIYDWNEVEPRPERKAAITLDDETLRDGLQSPSVFDPKIEHKIEILHLMDRLGIQTADIGLPGAGPRAVADVTRLAEEIRDSKLKITANCAARTVIADVQPVVDIVQKTGVPIMVCVFLGSSEIRRVTENWDMERMLRHTTEAIDFAVKEGLEVMYVTEDTARAKPETIRALYTAAIEHGASRLCVCDTVGHIEPRGVYTLMSFMRDLVTHSGAHAKLDWHGHNDRGLGLINAIAAVEAGADQVHGCALGIGERCGNTAMDQLIVNLKLMGYLDESLDLTALPEYVKKVSEYCKVPLPKNYPVVGPDAFETATGVHAAAVIKALKRGDDWLANRVYSGVPADVFGLEQVITVGPMSGRSNVVFWLEKRGLEASDERVDRIFDAAKQASRILTEDELRALAAAPAAV
ncbi:MAG: LeuA family protein [Planctomycetota bacterium]